MVVIITRCSVIKSFQRLTFNGVQQLDVVFGDDSEGFAAATSSGGSAHSVNVYFGLRG